MPLETPAAQLPPPPVPVARPDVTIGSLISRCFGVWWNNMFRFAGFTIVLFLPIILVMAGTIGVGAMAALAGGSREAMAGLAGGTMMVVMFAVVFPLMLVAAVVQMGGLTYGGVQHLAGRPVRFGGMFSAGFSRFFPLVGLGLLVFLAFMGVSLVISLVAGVAGAILGRAAGALGAVFAIAVVVAFAVLAILVMCGLAASVPAVVAERAGPIDAIRRSWGLTRGYRGSIFVSGLVLFLAWVGIYLVSMALSFIPLLGIILNFVIQVLTGSLLTVMPAVIYHDLRTAKEGASTEDLVSVFE